MHYEHRPHELYGMTGMRGKESIREPLRFVILRWIEMGCIFLGIPLLLQGDLVPRPKSIILLIVCAACTAFLLRDRKFDRRRFGLNGFRSWRGLAVRFGLVACCLVLYTVLIEPEKLAAILRHDPTRWAIIMASYPLLSVIPQEIVYRLFFFHRYGRLFPGTWAKICVNGVLFAFAHVFFKNRMAVVGAFIAGILWAATYLRSRSLLVVSIEHALYGNLVFTIGMGHYFYNQDF